MSKLLSDKLSPYQNVLHTVALNILEICTVVSLYFLCRMVIRQNSLILNFLFTGWVLLPLVGVFIVDRHFKRSAFRIQKWVQWLMITVGVLSAISYSGILVPSGTKPAFVFIITPAVLGLIILIPLLLWKRG
ncbi:MAG: hypothetical protein JSS93_06705 [Bacteroidetes bacterium]|nr:hypothetical protein [Bacteroidota bacterium]